MLEARALACQRGDAVLFRDLSFAVHSGEALLVRGANGSGKTSLLRIVAGLATPASGELLWNGARLQTPAARQAMTYIGHVPPLKDDLTPLENLSYALRLEGVCIGAEQSLAAIAAVGLAARRHLAVRHLSQGQKRRIGLARLMLSERRLWLLDEPLTALDVAGVALFNSRLEMHLKAGGTAVLSTHQDLAVQANIRELQLQ